MEMHGTFDILSLRRRPVGIMYWPLGAPRIYAYSRKRRKSLPQLPEGRDGEVDTDNASRNVLGLRVSRSGHLFATITETALIIWQTNVSARHGKLADSD